MKTGLFAIMCAVLLSACAAPSSPANTGASKPALPDFPSLSGDWRVTSLEGKVLAPGRVTMRLAEDGSFSGTGGCNRYHGSFSVAEGALKAGPVASTMMACEQAIMDLEYRYLGALQKVVGLHLVQDGPLQLMGANGQVLALLVKLGPATD